MKLVKIRTKDPKAVMEFISTFDLDENRLTQSSSPFTSETSSQDNNRFANAQAVSPKSS